MRRRACPLQSHQCLSNALQCLQQQRADRAFADALHAVQDAQEKRQAAQKQLEGDLMKECTFKPQTNVPQRRAVLERLLAATNTPSVSSPGQ